MSISTFLKENPMVMAGITAIVGGGTSTVIITWLLNKFKWIPESLGNQITSFFKTNVLIKEQLMDHDGNTLAGIEAFLNSLDNKILNQNKYTKVKQIKQTIPGTYYIFNKFKEFRVIILLKISVDKNTTGHQHASKTEVSSYALSIIGGAKNRSRVLSIVYKTIEEHTMSKNAVDISKKLVCIQVEAKSKNYGTTEIALVSKSKRHMNTVFLDPKIKDRVVNHINTFKNNRESYDELSIPYKTGIILYGPPGTGKTSLINAICSENDFLMMRVSANETVTDIRSMLLNYRMDNALDRMKIQCCLPTPISDVIIVVVIEEIDRYIKSGGLEEGQNSETSRTEQLMQLLDGIDSPENVIFVATTNNYDQLDQALVRPGRFDLSIEIGRMSHETANTMSKFMVGKTVSEFNPTYLSDTHINSSALFGELLQEKMTMLMKQEDV